jgi:hypothetical protein
MPYKAEKRGYFQLTRQKEPNWAFEALRFLQQQPPFLTKQSPQEETRNQGNANEV